MTTTTGIMRKPLFGKGISPVSIFTIIIAILVFGLIVHQAVVASDSRIRISRISMIPWEKNVVYVTDTELMIIVWDSYHSKMVNVDVTISGCNITEQTERTQHWGATYPPFSLNGISLPSGVLNGTIKVVTEKEGFESMTFEIIVVAR